MKRKSAVAVACLTFFLCMTTVTHANGNIQTGWISYGGHKYYLHPNGTMAKGWVFTDGIINT